MKIKNLIIFTLAFLSVSASAQEIQLVDTTRWLCSYNYEFLQDSTSKYSLKSEQMTLQIGLHSSKFCSKNQIFTDSLLYVTRNEDMASSSKKIIASMNGNYTHTFCNYKIYKNFPNKGTMKFSSYQGGKFLRVTQTKGLKWKIEAEIDTIILGYNCQMARISFAGRNYIAWFTPEIPISDGPYKFHGLPGLIVKISDTKDQHCFTLTAIHKLKYIQPILYNESNYFDVTAEEFVKAMQANIASLFGKVQSGDITINSDEGKAKSLQKLKSKNNFIERY